jgi:hypothetical protein
MHVNYSIGGPSNDSARASAFENRPVRDGGREELTPVYGKFT